MNYCLTYRVDKNYIDYKNVTIIRLPYKDRNMVLKWAEDFEEKDFLIDCFNIEEINWKEIERLNKLSNNRIIVMVRTIEDLREAQNKNIRRFWGFPINSYFELTGIQVFEPEFIIPGPELFFTLDNIQKLGVKLFCCPNVAYDIDLPYIDGIQGTWIRPEDLETIYEPYIDTVYFRDCDRKKEEGLYRIYSIDKEWRTELQTLITNLDAPGVNRMLSSDISKIRTTCGQACLKGRTCRICKRAFYLANPQTIENYLKDLEA